MFKGYKAVITAGVVISLLWLYATALFLNPNKMKTKKEIEQEILTYAKIKDTLVGKAIYDAGYKAGIDKAIEEIEESMPSHDAVLNALTKLKNG